MPQPSDVTTDDLFDVLARLGCPTVFLPDDGHEPGPADLPQLIGALTAAVDRLAITHRVPLDADDMRAWAAGYLMLTGAAGPCGGRTAFDILTVRLQMFEALYEGLRTAGPTGDLLRACLGAASCYAVAGATAHAVHAGVIDGNRPDVRELSHQQLAEAHALLGAAARLDEQLRAALAETDRG